MKNGTIMVKEAQTLTPEEVAFLQKEQARKLETGTGLPQMKQLIINADKVDEDGNKIESDTWHIRGDKHYTDTISFRPLRYVNKFIRMVQGQDKRWKNENESIFVEGFEPAYDMKGTTGCGRIVGSLPDSWTEDQKQANFKKATVYGFMFGLATFPGEKPVLVNFRAAPAKAKVIRDAINKKTIGDLSIYQLDYTLKLAQVKGEKFPILEMTPDLNNVHTRFTDIIAYMPEVDNFISAHNKRIMSMRERLSENLKAGETFRQVVSLASDFDDEEGDNLDDILPLPKH
jgi:hypothetical protein